MTIHRLPEFLKPFFRSFCLELTRPQFAHLWSLMLSMALNLRSSKLVHLSRLLPFSTHRTRHGAFLASQGMDSPKLLRQTVSRMIRQFKPLPGEVIELILDDHRIAKRGKKMDRLSKIWDHKDQKFVHGHIVLFAAVCFRGVTLMRFICARWWSRRVKSVDFTGSAWRRRTAASAARGKRAGAGRSGTSRRG